MRKALGFSKVQRAATKHCGQSWAPTAELYVDLVRQEGEFTSMLKLYGHKISKELISRL